MTIKEQQIGIISEYLPKCVSDSTDCFVYGSIPRNRFDGARKSYASNVVYDDVLGLVDTTIFGGGERGMVLTTTGIYIKEVLSSPTYYSYENYSKMPLPSEVFFIQGNLSVMFKKLAELANKAVKQNNAKGFWGSLLEFAGETIVSAIEESAETYKNELIAQQEKENEEALESICNIRDTIKDLREVFSEMIIDYDDLETYDEVYNKIVGTYVLWLC